MGALEPHDDKNDAFWAGVINEADAFDLPKILEVARTHRSRRDCSEPHTLVDVNDTPRWHTNELRRSWRRSAQARKSRGCGTSARAHWRRKNMQPNTRGARKGTGAHRRRHRRNRQGSLKQSAARDDKANDSTRRLQGVPTSAYGARSLGCSEDELEAGVYLAGSKQGHAGAPEQCRLLLKGHRRSGTSTLLLLLLLLLLDQGNTELGLHHAADYNISGSRRASSTHITRAPHKNITRLGRQRPSRMGKRGTISVEVMVGTSEQEPD